MMRGFNERSLEWKKTRRKKILKINTQEKDTEYDPEGKFGGVYDYKAGEWIMNAVKSGKLKIDPPVSEDK